MAQRPIVAAATPNFGNGRERLGNSDPPVAEPKDEPDNLSDSSEGCTNFSPEGLIRWLYERCDRRHGKAVVAHDPQKTHKYELRKGLLLDLMQHMSTARDEG